MGLKRKLEGEIEIREGAGDVFHEIYATNPHHTSQTSSHFVEGCDLHEGELGKPGSVLVWKYKVGEKKHTTKTIVEELNKEKKLMKQRCIEGTLVEEYKSFIVTCQVIPKDDETSIVKWTFEYEKPHPDVPEPSTLLDSLLAAAKDIDDHHHGIKK